MRVGTTKETLYFGFILDFFPFFFWCRYVFSGSCSLTLDDVGHNGIE